MKLFKLSVLILLCLSAITSAQTVRYVSLSGSNESPYTSIETAATNIQTAIDESAVGDIVEVGIGTYALTANISVTKAITIRSLSGAAATIIDGQTLTRCLYIDNAQAVIDGFTITRGYNPYNPGDGNFIGHGGGVNIVSGGTVKNCIITNSQARDGGGVAIDNSGIVENCIIKGNKADNNGGGGYGGGVRMLNGGITRGCLIYGNTSVDRGGGINIWEAGTIQNCTIINNTAPNGAGVKLRSLSEMENTISYNNNGDNWSADDGGSYTYTNNCTTPALPTGTGNITGDPLFADAGAENYSLSAASPCINAGANQDWMTGVGVIDLHGNTRILNGTVDIGAYETGIFAITVTAGENGTITPGGPVTVINGTSQTFTITAAAGYHIVNVLADGVSQGQAASYTFNNITANHSISATFAIDVFTITPTSGANGTITPGGVTSVNYGASQTFTITPNAGYNTADVKVDGVSQGSITSYTFTDVKGNHTIEATFAENAYTITATQSANGTITPGGVSNVSNGGSKTYTITANTGYHVATVLVDGVDQGAITTYTFTNVTSSHAITATFAINTYKITSSAGANGTITPSGETIINYGGSQSYTIAAAAGYYISDVLVDGVSVGAVSSYTFENICAVHTISASFVNNQLTITSSAGSNGTISPLGATKVNYGGAQTYTITPNACYQIKSVVVDGISQGVISSYAFTNVTANHTITASFDAKISASIPVPVTSYPNGGATVYELAPNLNWYFNESTSGIISLELQYSTASDFSINTVTKTDINPIVRSLQITGLQAGTIYYWRLRAKGASAFSEYSATASFITDQSLGPVKPVPTWPVSNADMYLNPATLYWYCTSQASGLKFNVRYGTDPLLGTYTEVPLISGTSLTLPKLAPGKWYWQVNAVAGGVSSLFSTPEAFTIVAPAPTVVIPKPSWPVGNALVYTNTPALYWYTETSTVGITFRVKFSTDPNNTNANGDLCIIEAGNSLSVTLPVLQWGKTYYWQVMSIGGTTSSLYSAIESFTVTGGNVIMTPEVPIAAWPVGGATVYYSSQSLSWYLLSGGSNIASYTVRWGESGTLSNVINNITEKSTVITGLLPGHSYSWQVESVDLQGHHSAACAAEQFVTSGGTGNKPFTPCQSWPVGGATVYSTTPTLSWYLSEASFGITGYKIRYSKNPDMSNAIENYLSGEINTKELPNLEKGATYYWQVQSYDGRVYSDPQIPPASFCVYSDNAASTPMVLSPVGSVGIASSSVNLSWMTRSESKSLTYNLQYSTDPEFSNVIEVKDLNRGSIKLDKLSNSAYYWRVQSKTQDGILSGYSPTGKFLVQGITGITEIKMDIEGFNLLQNYPNPFNPTTSIMFNLSNESYVSLEIFNSIGKSVGKIFEGSRAKGLTSIQFNADGLPSGIYFYKITAVEVSGKTYNGIRKMMVLK